MQPKTIEQWATQTVAERRANGAGAALDSDGKVIAELGDELTDGDLEHLRRTFGEDVDAAAATRALRAAAAGAEVTRRLPRVVAHEGKIFSLLALDGLSTRWSLTCVATANGGDAKQLSDEEVSNLDWPSDEVVSNVAGRKLSWFDVGDNLLESIYFAQVDGRTVRIAESTIDEGSGKANVKATIWGRTVELTLYVERQTPSGFWTRMQDSEVPAELADYGITLGEELAQEIAARLPRS